MSIGSGDLSRVRRPLASADSPAYNDDGRWQQLLMRADPATTVPLDSPATDLVDGDMSSSGVNLFSFLPRQPCSWMFIVLGCELIVYDVDLGSWIFIVL